MAIESGEESAPGRQAGPRAVQAGDITGSTVVTGDHVTVLQGPGTVFTTSTPAEWAEATRRAVGARRRLRRERLGLTSAQVTATFAVEDALPDAVRDAPAGVIRVLTGPLGAGKSDLAERWLLAATDRYDVAPETAPVPLWVSATDVSGPLQDHVLRLLGRADVLRTQGVDLVVDGLDERPAAASALLEQAATLVATAPQSRVVLSARAGVPVPESITVLVPEWERDAALRLIAAVAGIEQHAYLDHSWPESLRRTVRRPFFALLAGAYSRDPAIPATGAGLIDRAVRQALGPGGPMQALRAVAVRRTQSGRAVDLHAYDDADALLASRLLVVEGGRAVFALPIFEQWFTAQAMLLGEADVEVALRDLASFSRWRYAIAVAVASGEVGAVDRLMDAVARWNPGAASWLVREAISSRLSVRAEPAALGDWLTVGRSIRSATGAWIQGLGPARRMVDPVRWLPKDDLDPLRSATLSVAVEQGWIHQAWTSAEAVPGPVAYGPPHPFAPYDDLIGWCGVRGGTPSPSPNWVWRWTLEDLAKDVEDTLVLDVEQQADPSGVIAQEWRYDRARALLSGRQSGEPGTWGTVLRRVAEMLDHAAGAENINFRIGHTSLTVQDLERLQAMVGSDDDELVIDPWPGEDGGPGGGWVWSGYTPERLLARTQAVYAGAIAAYREFSQGPLTNFGDTLAHAALLPAVLEGRLRHPVAAPGTGPS